MNNEFVSITLSNRSFGLRKRSEHRVIDQKIIARNRNANEAAWLCANNEFIENRITC